jgi:phage protein U
LGRGGAIRSKADEPKHRPTVGKHHGHWDVANLNALRALQNQRAPLVLADGYGNNLGQWTIKRLQEKQDKIIDDGTAFVLAFTLELEEYANDNHP